MMIRQSALVLAACLVCMPACDTVQPVDPGVPAGVPAAAVDTAVRHALDGVYRVVDGGAAFGGTVVLRWNGSRMNLFAEKDYIFGTLSPLRADSVFHFRGRAWFNSSDRACDLDLRITPADGGADLALGRIPSRLVVTGTRTEGAAAGAVTLVRERPLHSPRMFWIVAHRGGGNNGGRFDIPDNSLEMIRSAEDFGANGIEIDVRITRDGVPILYHDDNFSPRLVNGEFLHGPVNAFTFRHIRAFGTLRNGEPVAALREALDAVLASTSLRFVELDVKNPETLPFLFDIQSEYHARARTLGRDLTIYIDLPSRETADAYRNDPRHADAACMCELDLATVAAVGARIWSPRWTLGTLAAEAAAVRAQGRMFIPWTVNEPQFIDALIDGGQVDGVLTDAPNIIAYSWYAHR